MLLYPLSAHVQSLRSHHDNVNHRDMCAVKKASVGMIEPRRAASRELALNRIMNDLIGRGDLRKSSDTRVLNDLIQKMFALVRGDSSSRTVMFATVHLM